MDQLHADLLGRLDYDRRDDVLAALIRLAQRDEQAGVVLMSCLLPGLRGVIRRHGSGLGDEDAEAIALSALYERTHRYPLARRPRRIAMNLLMDTAHDLIATRGRELSWRTHTYITDQMIDRTSPAPTDLSPGLLWAATHAAGILTTREIALIHTTRVRDLRLAHIAPLLGLTHDAARKARQRGEHKLRSWWQIESPAA
jgi:hypothetical protein